MKEGINATMHTLRLEMMRFEFAPSTISKFNFADFCSLFAAHRLLAQDDSVRQQVKRVIKEKEKNIYLGAQGFPVHEDIAF